MRTKIRRKVSGSRVRWYVSTIGADGKESHHGGFATQREAKAAELTSTGRSTNPTLGDFLVNEWLPSRETKVAPSTLEAYGYAVRAWVNPTIGDVRLQDLTVGDLERLYGVLRTRGGRLGQPLSPKTVRNCHLVLSKAFGLAIRSGYIQSNLCALVERDEDEPRTEREAWTIEEARTFLDAAVSDRLHAVWRLMLSTGIRRGETLGATWDAIDLDARTLVVRQQVLLRGHVSGTDLRMYVRPTTKGRRPRTVSFDEATAAALRTWKAQQATERLAFGPRWNASGGVRVESQWVVTEPDGCVIHPDTLNARFVRLAKNAGVRQLVLHGTRHSFATIALRSGVRLDLVSKALGHASSGFTADRYIHSDADERTTAADVMGAALGGTTDA